MSDPAQPFRDASRQAVVPAKGASCRYVANAIRAALEDFSITGDDTIQITQEGKAVHLKFVDSGGAGSSFPFQLTASAGGVTINSGFIAIGGGGTLYPTVDGVKLRNDGSNPNWTPPELELGEGAWYIVLSISLLPTLSQLNVGGVPITCLTGSTVPSAACSIQALSTPPADTPSIIDYTGQSAPTEGSYNIHIGTVQIDSAGNVTVLEQVWKTCIASAMNGDGSLFLATR